MAFMDLAVRVFTEDFDRAVKRFQQDLDSGMLHSVMKAADYGVIRARKLSGKQRTGNLAKSMHSRISRLSDDYTEAAYGPNVPYARFVEYDTKPHEIVGHDGNRANGMLVFWVRGRKVVTKRVPRHPGTKGKHFLERSIPGVRNLAERTLRAKVRAAISGFGGP